MVRCLAGFERTKKDHCHVYVQFKVVRQLDSVKKQIARAFLNRGSSKSISVVRNIGEISSYIVKELPDGDLEKLVFRFNYSANELLDAFACSYDKKKKNITVGQELIHILHEKLRLGGGINEDQIEEIVHDFYVRRKIGMNWFVMDNYCNMLIAHLDKKKSLSDFRQYRLNK